MSCAKAAARAGSPIAWPPILDHDGLAVVALHMRQSLSKDFRACRWASGGGEASLKVETCCCFAIVAFFAIPGCRKLRFPP